MSKLKSSAAGFTLAELLIVVAVISMLVTIALPKMDVANKQGEASKCKGQLQAIELATEASAMDNGNWATTTSELVTGGYLRQDPSCRWNGSTFTYQLATAAGQVFTFQDGTSTTAADYPSGTAFCPIHGTIKEFRENGTTTSSGGSGGGGVTQPE